MVLLKILLLIPVFYMCWVVIGCAVLWPHVSIKIKKTKYQCRTMGESVYELTFWPKVLREIKKHTGQ